VFNIKLVELEIMKISCLGNFSSYYMILGVIWQKQFEIKNLGGCYSTPVNQSSAARSMGAGEACRGFRVASRRRRGSQQLLDIAKPLYFVLPFYCSASI
jgi:hypothetical protein